MPGQTGRTRLPANARGILFPALLAVLFFGLVLVFYLRETGRSADYPACRIADPAKSLTPIFPARHDWPTQSIEDFLDLARRIGSTSLIVLHEDRLVVEWGETAKRTSSHSVRKSLISALYGIAVDRGFINLDASLAELGIDDLTPLTEQEKQATVRDLMKARSGIYLPAAAESAEMRAKRPARGSHLPGEYWYYNNWDFNVLGTIFEKETGFGIGEAFAQWIAHPLGMLDFRPEDVHMSREPVSRHAAYPFYISARDLAIFGSLFLNDGVWRGYRVLPEGWVSESTSPCSVNGDFGYGYLWWTFRDEAFYAAGFGGQYVILLPAEKMVIVNRVDTGQPGPERRQWLAAGERVDSSEMLELARMIISARPATTD